MKNKAPLALMEQLIMLMVFAIAAALCLHAGKQAVQDVDVAQLVAQVREAGSFV